MRVGVELREVRMRDMSAHTHMLNPNSFLGGFVRSSSLSILTTTRHAPSTVHENVCAYVRNTRRRVAFDYASVYVCVCGHHAI